MTDADVPGGRVIVKAGGAAARGSASGALTFVSMARGVAEAVAPTALTTTGIPVIVVAVVAELERRRDRTDWRDWRDNFLAVVVVAPLIVAWLDYQQNAAEQARPDPAPNVTVVAPQPDITVVVPPAPAPQLDGADPVAPAGNDAAPTTDGPRAAR